MNKATKSQDQYAKEIAIWEIVASGPSGINEIASAFISQQVCTGWANAERMAINAALSLSRDGLIERYDDSDLISYIATEKGIQANA